MQSFVRELLGWRTSTVPNVADGESDASVTIASEILTIAKVPRTVEASTPGVDALRSRIAGWLGGRLEAEESERHHRVETFSRATQFSQYVHLRQLEKLALDNPVVATELGSDLEVRPDLTIAIDSFRGGRLTPMLLHAALWCRWTIRSDRVQSLRRDAQILIHHRHGRLPHLAAITAEPLPSRLAAIAQGSGDVDRVYHLTLHELRGAVKRVGSSSQQRILSALIEQSRLQDVDELLSTVLL